jgi:hypothetical protein
MTVSQRNVLRLVVPPLLAPGLVALVTDTMDASSMPTVTDLQTTQLHSASSSGGPSGPSVSVDIPPVSLAREVRSVRGTIRTPVLLADPTVTGRAYVVPGDRCAVDLVPGVVRWLACDTGPGSVVRVRLSDGRVFQTVVH